MLQTCYFLGANSPSGFYSLYDELSDPNRMTALYILKGGPGCGKSTFMRRVARHAESAGLIVHYILCSADPDSLDAIILPQKGIAVVDGTAPHVIEATCPGAVDAYVDLSRFYDHNALQAHKSELISVTAEYKGCYKQAYRCLGAAGELRRNLIDTADSAELRLRLQKRAKGIVSRELKKATTGSGKTERRFLSAVTHKGILHLWDTVRAQADRVYELADNHGAAHYLLSPILSSAQAAGHHVVICPDPMAPDRLSHLILPDLSLAFVTSSAAAPWPGHSYRRIRLDAMADDLLKNASKPRLRFTRKMADALTEDGISELKRAKETHDKLEAIYNPNVDFDGVNAAADSLADIILA